MRGRHTIICDLIELGVTTPFLNGFELLAL